MKLLSISSMYVITIHCYRHWQKYTHYHAQQSRHTVKSWDEYCPKWTTTGTPPQSQVPMWGLILNLLIWPMDTL